MIPGLEEKMSERLQNAPFEELMPGFDKEAEWQMLAKQMAPEKRTIPLRSWAYAATILLLIGAATCWFMLRDNTTPRMASTKKAELQPAPKAPAFATNTDVNPKITSTIHPSVSPTGNTIRKSKTKEVIRNTTPCPIEICISQTMKCPNSQPSAISTYSTLQPSQSVELHYKDDGNIEKNCSVVVKAIEFKSIATGETILLNSSSAVTAQEVFSYMTGQKKGDVLAGVFSLDCNNKTRKHRLKLDNSYGNLVLQ